MSGRALITLNSSHERERGLHWLRNVPDGTRVEFKAPLRSLDQNSRMWAMLTDIATQIPWHGMKLSTEDYKVLFLDALHRETRMVPNLDNNGYVPLGRSSSDLSKAEMSDMITLLFMFGDKHGVVWKDPAIVSQLRQLDGAR